MVGVHGLEIRVWRFWGSFSAQVGRLKVKVQLLSFRCVIDRP